MRNSTQYTLLLFLFSGLCGNVHSEDQYAVRVATKFNILAKSSALSRDIDPTSKAQLSIRLLQDGSLYNAISFSPLPDPKLANAISRIFQLATPLPIPPAELLKFDILRIQFSYSVLNNHNIQITDGETVGEYIFNALKMVKSLNLGSNLMNISFQTAIRTITYKMIADKLGSQKANEMLRTKLILVTPKYQKQWDINLAQAYEGLLSPEEFESLTLHKQGSPYFQKFLDVQNKAGTAMKAISKNILIEVTSEALKSAYEITSENNTPAIVKTP